PTVAAALMQRHRVADTNSPLWAGAVHAGQVEGVPARSSTAMPAASMIYGDWSSLLIGQWGVLELETNPYANFQAGIVGMRALWTTAVALRHLASFTVATSIT
ncbi:phage major capsid protein, partial [Arthrospira platensis SPKY2]